VGLATVMAMAPVVRPAHTLWKRLGFTPSGRGPVKKSLTGTYIPILSPANTTYLWSPAVSPPKSARDPSSAAMVFTVPMIPLYFGISPIGVCWIYSLTLAVSTGIVTASAKHAEKEAIPTFLRKNFNSDSPSAFFDCIMFLKIK